MTQACPIAETALELPASAPQIRVTAGVGSAGQKTWNLRRPVTLLGSKRPAHIVLHDRGISVAHCAIVNTGTDVVLFDLHTSGGTFRGKDRVDLVALQDGDVISLGETTIHVAIRQPSANADDSGAGIEYVDPTLMVDPVSVSLIHTDSRWTIERAVALIGRLDNAAIRLDHAEVSTRHALLFRFGRQPAVFDLGGRAGVWVNGQKRDISTLVDGDRITVGPFGLQLQIPESANATNLPQASASTATTVAPAESNTVPPTSVQTSAPATQPAPSVAAAKDSTPTTAAPVTAAVAPTATPNEPAASEPRSDPLQNNIAEAWERLNQWRAQLRNDAAAITQQQSSLSAKEAQLEARDAALRGQLHDITRFNEKLAERENDLARYAAQIQEQADAFGAAQKEFLDRLAEVQKKEEELHRREQALNQRWSRMQSTTCPHCRKPVSIGGT